VFEPTNSVIIFFENARQAEMGDLAPIVAVCQAGLSFCVLRVVDQPGVQATG
jgi:hypothetical protein